MLENKKTYKTITPVERLFFDFLKDNGECGTECVAKGVGISTEATLDILNGLNEINLIEKTNKSLVNHFYWKIK
jgi:hypothetical protein